MRNEVTVVLDARQEYKMSLEGVPPMAADEARTWLDQQFIALECEPLRASGKLLSADRVVCVAQAAGPQRFSDATWSRDFARAATAALGQVAVRVDVPALAVTY